MSRSMGIGDVARRTGVSTRTIRYYEETGVIPQAERAHNGYRVYGERAVHVLRFVRRARDLGFSVEDVGSLLALWADERRESADVRTMAQRHLGAIERKIEELETLRSTLRELVDHCHGDARAECPILDDLAAREGDRERGGAASGGPRGDPGSRSGSSR